MASDERVVSAARKSRRATGKGKGEVIRHSTPVYRVLLAGFSPK